MAAISKIKVLLCSSSKKLTMSLLRLTFKLRFMVFIRSFTCLIINDKEKMPIQLAVPLTVALIQ